MSVGLQDERTSTEPAKEMDPERKVWLKEAMQNLLRDPIADMKAAVKNLDETEDSIEKAKILESLIPYVEHIDLARDLHKIGGLVKVVALLKDGDCDVRASAAHVIGVTVHNNPEPQEWALELGALEGLCEILKRPGASTREVTKAVLGISGLVRHNDVATVKFVKDMKGMALLLEVLKRDEQSEDLLPARRKAMFLLFYLLNRAPAILAPTAPHYVPAIADALDSHKADPDFREHAVQVLRLYHTNDKVVVTKEVKARVAELTRITLDLARADEHDTVVEACEDLLEALRI